MKFLSIPLSGAYVIEPELIQDSRGFFARSFCVNEFAAYDLDTALVQCNISFSSKAGTLRGMHFQVAPHEEAKLVRCTMGAIYDVIVDLRPGSATFRRWYAVELTAQNRRMLYIPKGFAHGFQALQDNSEVFYQMSEFYHPESSRGVLFDDPSFAVAWPLGNPIISDRDRSYPLFDAPTQ